MKQITTFFVFVLFSLSFDLQAQDPNIILIIADDMGWNQVSSTTTTFVNGAAHPSDFYETPILDQLASEGISFPNGYVNGANCAPTRAALLSGQYAARPHNNVFTVYDLNRGNTASNSNLIGPVMGLPVTEVDEIPASAITIAESMKIAGYATAHFGKYHMGEFEDTNVSNNAATDQGFDYNYGGGTTGGPGNYFATESGGNWTFHGNVGPELDPYADPYTEAESIALSIDHANHPLTGTPKHVTDAMTEAAIDFINTEINNPFFMHFSQFAIHGPFGTAHARPDLLAKYQAKKSSNPSSMNHDSDVGQVAIAEGMDQAIGRLIDYLQTTPDPRNGNKPLSENTLVYFIADNGDAIKRSGAKQGQTPLKGMKGEYYEGGIRSITFAWTEPADPIGNPTYTPMLANMGTINQTPIIAFDLYPTFVEAAGGTLPGGGYDIDGESQWQMLTNGTAMTREALFWHHPGYLIDSKRDSRPVTVVRKGDYKLMHFYEDAHYELYNLVSDLNENNNLLPSGDQAIIDIANDMITDIIDHLTDTSAPLPTYRDGGATVPMPTYVSASGGSNSTAGCQPETGYEAFWDFDTASDANDASGNGHDPNPVNGTLTYDSSDFMEGDQSVVFDGTVDINYSDGTFLSPESTARSFSVWIKPTALVGNQNIIEEGGLDDGIALRLEGSNLVSMLKNTGTDYSLSTAFPNDGNWHHVGFVYDGATTTQTIYIDGVLAISGTAPASIPSRNTTGGGIGGVIGNWDSFGAAGTESFFTGKMDAFAVYESALTLTQVQNSACYSANSNAGCQAESGFEAYWDFDTASTVNDASGNGHDPDTYSGSGSLSYDLVDFVEGDQSIVFDGDIAIRYATYLDADTFLKTYTQAKSVMAWVKPSNLTGIQNIYDEGGKNRGIAIRLNNGTLEAIVRETSSTAYQTSATFPNDGEWHHIALTYEGNGVNTQRLYIDGVEVDTNTAPFEVIFHDSHSGIGGRLSGTDSFNNTADVYFTGKMDAFAVYDNTVLTPTQIENSSCLSLSNNEFKEEIGNVYPNPFNNKLSISLKNYNENIIVELFDILGKVTFANRYANTNSIEIPTSDLAQGLYLLRIKTKDGEVIKKVVKE